VGQGQSSHPIIKEIVAGITKPDDKPANRVPVNVGDSLSGSDRIAFQQELEGYLGHLDRNLHRPKLGCRFALAPGLTAKDATEALSTASVPAETLYLVVFAGGGYHSEIPFFMGSR
jgi:hypothetical protein